jgi:outer membrane biosynthesis protein TonB
MTSRRKSKSQTTSTPEQSPSLAENRSKRKRTPAKVIDENEEEEEPPKKYKKVIVKFTGSHFNEEEEEHQQQQQQQSTAATTVSNNNQSSSTQSTTSITSTQLIQVIQQLYLEDQNYIFYYAVSEADVPGYHTIIKHPMDLSTLKSNLCQVKYKTFSAFKV